jgi:hypothetical protein
MSNPFSGIPDPEQPRPIRRPSQPGPAQEALRAFKDTLRARLPVAQAAVRRAQRVGKDALWRAKRVAKEGRWQAQRYGQNLWFRAKRRPRTFGAAGAAVALTLVGAFALSASGAGRSLCPPTSDRKTPQFRLLMDPIPPVAAGSDVEIYYDVCGLALGTPYKGRVRLVQQPAAGKKKSAKPKPLVVSFKDQVDGVATRRHQQVDLSSTRPGVYTLELSIADKQGRERKRVQKIRVKAPR